MGLNVPTSRTDTVADRKVFSHFLEVVVVDRFCIAQFSAFEQTHCARMCFYMCK